MSTFDLNRSRADRATISVVRENLRSHLLMALSEARSATINMEPRFREKLMDDVTKRFHPEGNASDLFTDAFYSVEEMVDEDIEQRESEIRNPVRVRAAE